MEQIFTLFSLGKAARISLAASLFALGAMIHMLFPWGTAPGFILILAGYAPLLLKKITNKPSDKGLEEWRPVSMAEIDKIADSLAETKKKRTHTMGGTAGRILLSLLGLVVVSVSFAMASETSAYFSRPCSPKKCHASRLSSPPRLETGLSPHPT
ncbi:MAG: hypothetical protein FD137_1532 [Spirochaetes bacterium]|nr:MAG: hypothetical protein FD137_1532 [Spirochaetota bacterium]